MGGEGCLGGELKESTEAKGWVTVNGYTRGWRLLFILLMLKGTAETGNSQRRQPRDLSDVHRRPDSWDGRATPEFYRTSEKNNKNLIIMSVSLSAASHFLQGQQWMTFAWVGSFDPTGSDTLHQHHQERNPFMCSLIKYTEILGFSFTECFTMWQELMVKSFKHRGSRRFIRFTLTYSSMVESIKDI